MSSIPVHIRANEGCAPQPELIWDSVWDPTIGAADWAYSGPVEVNNQGGLQARHALDTAVILCLFTDRFCPPDHPLAKYIEADDPRGWWGDGIDVRTDLGEAPLGSLLWLLERATATADNAIWARSLAIDALSVMAGQGSVARVDAQAYLNGINRIDLAIQLYGRDGAKLYDRRFDDIWNQSAQIQAAYAAYPALPVLATESGAPIETDAGGFLQL